jgi:hypothetical protein
MTMLVARTRTVILLCTTLALGSCATSGSVTVATDPAGSSIMSLQQLADRCASSTDDSGVGLVDVTGELRDANVTVDIPAPCLVRLGQDADVTLNNVTLTAAALHLDDLEADAGPNRVRVQRSTVNLASLLVSLSDPDDELSLTATTVAAEGGLVVEVAGTRDEENTGGRIQMVNSHLEAADPDGAGVVLTTSEHDGWFRSVNLTIDTPADLVVVAGDCQAQRTHDGPPADCSTDALVDDLRRQASELEGS